MTDYSLKSGGVKGGRPLNTENPFEMALVTACGPRICKSDSFAADVWGALSNVDWQHENGDTFSCSWRQAGDVIAAIRGKGDYMDWYCSGESGVVPAEVATAMAEQGWTFTC